MGATQLDARFEKPQVNGNFAWPKRPKSGKLRPVRRFRATELVGRTDELRTLRDLAAAAVGGAGAIAAIVGEPGTGKTRLAGELTALAEHEGSGVVRGACLEGSRAPLRPIVEALLDGAPGGSMPDWLVAGRPPDDEAHGVVLAEAVVRSVAARGAGSVLHLDDLHWADADTLDVVIELTTLVRRHPVLVVVTARPACAEVVRVVEAIERVDHGAVVRLDKLDAAAVDALIESCLGGGAPADVLRFVRERSDGVPLFVEELLAGLDDAGALVETDGVWSSISRVAPVVPASFDASVTRRLAGLDRPARSVVEAAALLGREFDWRLLAPITGRSAAEVDAALREAVEAQLLEVAGGRYQFRHALTRDSVVARLAPTEQAELARSALAELDLAGDRSDHDLSIALARLAGDDERAGRELVAAASEALASGALATATELVAMADVLQTTGAVRADLDELAVETHSLAGRTQAASERGQAALSDLARRPGTEQRRIRVSLALARAELAAGEWERAARHAAAARVLHDVEPDAAALARILAIEAHVAINQRRTNDAIDAAEAAVAAAARAGLGDVQCEALEVLGRAERFLRPDSTRHFEQALAVASSHGLGAWRVRAMMEVAIDRVFRDGVFGPLLAAREVAESAGALVSVAVIDLHLAGINLVSGRREIGLEIAERCVDDCRRYRLSMLPIALLHVADGHALHGDNRRAEAAMDEVLSHDDGSPEVEAAVWGWVRGDMAFVAGDEERWLECLDRAMDALRGHEGTVPFPFRAMWPLLRTAADRDGAAAREEVRASHVMVVLGNSWPLDVADAIELGRGGRHAEAEEVFGEAARRLGDDEWSRWQRHRVRLVAARPALRDGWGDPASWLREAEVYFDTAGYPDVAARCRRIAREAGLTVRRRGRGDSVVPPSLAARGVSSREMDVLHQLVARATNREIGDRLHLSVRTVEKHVASLMLKLEAGSRRELAEQAQRAIEGSIASATAGR